MPMRTGVGVDMTSAPGGLVASPRHSAIMANAGAKTSGPLRHRPPGQRVRSRGGLAAPKSHRGTETVIVLQASAVGGRLFAWAEAPAEASRRGRRPKAARAQPSPFDAGAGHMTAALAEVCGGQSLAQADPE